MNRHILLLISLVLISSASAEELLCKYSDGHSIIINTSKTYQCPPVIPHFYRLESQEHYPPIMQGGGGFYPSQGGGSAGYSKPTEDKPEEPQIPHILSEVLFSLVVLFAFTVFLVWVYIKARR